MTAFFTQPGSPDILGVGDSIHLFNGGYWTYRVHQIDDGIVRQIRAALQTGEIYRLPDLAATLTAFSP